MYSCQICLACKVHSVLFWLFCPHPAHSHPLSSVIHLVSRMMTILYDFWDNELLINRKPIVRISFIEDHCGNSLYMPASASLNVVTWEPPGCWANGELKNLSKGNWDTFWSTNGYIEKAVFLLLPSSNLSSGFHNFIFSSMRVWGAFVFLHFCMILCRFGALLVFRLNCGQNGWDEQS